MAAATSSTKNVATTAATASTAAMPVVTTPPGRAVRPLQAGLAERSTMCDTLSSTYDTVAPKTAMLIS